MEPELDFCNQAKHSVVELGHQPRPKTFDIQPDLPAECAGTVVAQS